MSVTCDSSVIFSTFLHQWNWLPRFNWYIVESDVKHHKPKPNLQEIQWYIEGLWVLKMVKGKGHRWMPISTNISVISSRSFLLVEYLDPVRNNWPAASHRQTLLPGDIFEYTSQTLCQNQNQTYNFSCDRHQLHG